MSDMAVPRTGIAFGKGRGGIWIGWNRDLEDNDTKIWGHGISVKCTFGLLLFVFH